MRKGKVGECLMANDTRDRTRELQHKLYRAAKESPTRRFHALYDKVHRADVLGRAWSEVAANGGAHGVDGVSIAQVQEQGVEDFLDILRVELETGCYRPLPVRRVTIPKASGGTRNLGVPTAAFAPTTLAWV
jgi:retron-type reverse transcriptase